MADRYAEAVWEGDLKQGVGRMKLPAAGTEGRYSYRSRFEDGPGTNPEELLAAAHAGCFSMALAGNVGKAGFTPMRITTRATVTADRVEGRWTVTGIRLETTGQVKGLEAVKFAEFAEDAKVNCPISRALAGIPIQLDARLESPS
ncbi:MAG: OsmC family protein [Anaerolineales bacterium]